MQQPAEQELVQLNSSATLPVRLTRNHEKKVVKIEIYVDEQQRSQIFDHFEDKALSWKESAAHLLVLKGVAAYKKQQLTHKEAAKIEKPTAFTPNDLATLIKELCHATAPLYAFVNSPYLDNPYHPLHEKWKLFRDSHQEINPINLTVLFLKQELTNYKTTVSTLFANAPTNEALKTLQTHHQKNIDAFEEQLIRFSTGVVTKNQLQKLLSNQNQNDRIEIASLGEFLRSEAHAIVANAIPLLDEITAARFNQLFAFSAHPLRKELVNAKSALEKQRSTHASRFINTSAPIPESQRVILANKNIPSEKRWFNIMPYVNCKTLFDGTIDGAEGLDDVDKILCIYGNSNLEKLLQKEYSEPYKTVYEMITGKKGVWGILAILLFGFPAAIVCGVGLLVAMLAATLIDLGAFVLQASVIIIFSPIILFALAADFILQIPSFLTVKAEIKFSFLTKIAGWPIPPRWLKEIFRDFSLVRIFKQRLLEGHQFYLCETTLEKGKYSVLNTIKNDQAEGIFNVVARKFFTFSTIAVFLHQKMKQLFYALREIRKVLALSFDQLIYSTGNSEESYIQKCNKLIEQLTTQVDAKFKSVIRDKFDASTPSSVLSQPNIYNSLLWPSLNGWKSREYETPLDFISDIGRVLAHELVDPAFENNPAIATLTFVASLLCSSTLLFPSMATIIPEQIVKGLQLVPQYIAKGFMGKELSTGISNAAVNLISTFLQWKLSYFGTEGLIALYHGDIEWVKKAFENPEEITLGTITFISLGYAAGLIPQIPIDLSIFNQNHPENPFLKAITNYIETLYKGFAGALNTVTNESREVSENGIFGINSAELAFIGLKASLLVYGLLSGNHSVRINPLEINVQKLCDDFRDALPNPFAQATTESQKNEVIQTILQQHGIRDSESKISEFLLSKLDTINQVVHPLLPRTTQTTDLLHEERTKIKKLLDLVHDIETLGIPVNLVADNDDGVGYQSKVDAELMYDALYFAFENYNQTAQKLGLFHEQIEAHHLLHEFYNRHCYAGSSGWHKFIFGLLLFPITWLWRGFKYLIGTPSMRHQVRKSFSKDLAMLFQLIPDVIAPMLRSFLKAILYTIRMFLGIGVLPLLIVACLSILIHSIATGIFTIPRSFYAIYKGIQADDAKVFASKMSDYFSWVKTNHKIIWDVCLCNKFVNGYIKLISFIGSPSGTGSLHRLSLLKITGIATYYQTLAQEADTNSENLQHIVRDLIVSLKQNAEKAQNQPVESHQKMQTALAEYDQTSKKSWKIRASERTEQLEWLSASIWQSENSASNAIQNLEKELPNGSRLKQTLSELST